MPSVNVTASVELQVEIAPLQSSCTQKLLFEVILMLSQKSVKSLPEAGVVRGSVTSSVRR